MRRQTRLCISAVAFLVAGCNQPAVTPKAPDFQGSATTTRDWNDVAHRIASELALHGYIPLDAAEMQKTGIRIQPLPQPVYVRLNSPDSAFLHDVSDALRTDIVDRGGIAAQNPAGAIVVNLDVDFVKWGPRDKPPGGIGTIAAAAGVTGILTSASAPFTPWQAARAASWITGVAGVMTDGLIAIWPTMNAEAIWQASVVSRDRVLMQVRAPIYVRGTDIEFYYSTVKLAPMSTPGPATTAIVQQVRYEH